MSEKKEHTLGDHPTEDEIRKWFEYHFGEEIEEVKINKNGSFEIFSSSESGKEISRIFFKGGFEIHNTPCHTSKGLKIPIVGPYARSSPGINDDELPFFQRYHRPLEEVLADIQSLGPTTGFGGVHRDIILSTNCNGLPNAIGELWDPPGELHITPNLAGPAPYTITIDPDGGGYCPFCNTFNPFALQTLRCIECKTWFKTPTVAFQWALPARLEIEDFNIREG